jgi:hypothetical protein
MIIVVSNYWTLLFLALAVHFMRSGLLKSIQEEIDLVARAAQVFLLWREELRTPRVPDFQN